MSRLPFNPDRIPERSPKPKAAGSQPVTVSQLAGLIKNALQEKLPAKIQVVGEISNFSNRNHWFFSLKDSGASMRCVCFASTARRIRFAVEDGMQVVATGRIDFFDAAGNVQLYVDKIEPVGQGALELRLRQMIEQLRELGYFDDARKKQLPLLPRRVAVVTSRSAAALQDVINTATRRWPGCRLLLYDVRVQGEAAAGEIAAAINSLSQQGQRLNIDAILLTRGGGSIEDLWAFNERIVADALYNCTLPVVAAIGHETDTTVAELVADARCSTPTQAAMKLIPEQAALEQELRHWQDRLKQDIHRQIRHAHQRVDACANRALFRRPQDLVDQATRQVNDLARQLARALPHRLHPAQTHVDQLARRLSSAIPQRVSRAGEQLDRAQARLLPMGPRLLDDKRKQLATLIRHLEAVSPRAVLKRGYTYTLSPDGQVIRKAADVTQGQQLTTVFADGQVRSRVEGDGEPAVQVPPSPKKSAALAPEATATPKPRRRHNKPADDEQASLF